MRQVKEWLFPRRREEWAFGLAPASMRDWVVGRGTSSRAARLEASVQVPLSEAYKAVWNEASSQIHTARIGLSHRLKDRFGISTAGMARFREEEA